MKYFEKGFATKREVYDIVKTEIGDKVDHIVINIIDEQRNEPNGLAGLDANGKLAISQIPGGVQQLQSQSWDASTNTPNLLTIEKQAGFIWLVGTTGNTNLSGITDWQSGDYVIYLGSNTFGRIDNTDNTSLQILNNLSDLSNKTTARTNLDVFSKKETKDNVGALLVDTDTIDFAYSNTVGNENITATIKDSSIFNSKIASNADIATSKLKQAIITPQIGAFSNNDTQDVINNKAQGQITNLENLLNTRPVGASNGSVYYLTSQSSAIPNYELLSFSPDNSPLDVESITITSTTPKVNRLFHSYISTYEVGNAIINGGNWIFNFYGYTSHINNNNFEIDVYKRDLAGTETLLFSCETSNLLQTSQVSPELNVANVEITKQDFVCNTTDKIVVKIYAKTDRTVATTITLLHSGTDYASHIHTTLIASHNQLAGTQGGTVNEKYHLNLNDYNKVLGLDASFALKEDVANKTATFSATPANIKYPTEKLVKDNLDLKGNITDTRQESTRFVEKTYGLDTNDGLTIFKAFKTPERGWTDVNPSGQVKIIGGAEHTVNHTFASSKQSIKTILDNGAKISGTINLVSGNTSMQFFDGKISATINDNSTGTCYFNGVDLSGSIINFNGAGYKYISNSSSAPTLINFANLSGGATATATLININGGAISIGDGWTVIKTNSTLAITSKSSSAVLYDSNFFVINAVITSQVALNVVLSSGLAGLYIVNFASPTGITGISKGDIIYRVGGNNVIVNKFFDAPSSVSVANGISFDTWIKQANDNWVIGSISSSSRLDASNIADGSISNTEFQYLNNVSSNIQTQLDGKLNTTLKGANNGLAELDSTGKVPSSQLPAYVDDVLEFDNFASFPATGEAGKIYVAKDTNIVYRWGGTQYIEISSSLALGETSSTAYRGDRGKIAYDHSQTTGNPHSTTKGDIGLGNVDNTSDADKPISSATQTALNSKEPTITAGTTSQYYRGDKTFQTLDKNSVGLSNVANIDTTTTANITDSTDKRFVSDAEKTILSNTSGTNTGDETTLSIQTKRPLKTVSTQSLEGNGNISLSKSDVGLNNVDNTADANKNVLSATKLTTARNINGVSFDGTADITIADNTKEPAFTKNTAFNKNFGTTTDTVAEGNDARLGTKNIDETNIANNRIQVYNSTSGKLEYQDKPVGSTNLAIANKTSTTLDITSDTGNDATIPEATNTEAGLLSASDKVKLNNTSGTNTGDQDLSGLMVKAQNLGDVANRQTALNNITDVSSATNEYVLTKDTATGNAIFKPSVGGGSASTIATTATTGGTTTLTASSANIQRFTGTAGQILVLPDATTLTNAKSFDILNDCTTATGAISIRTNGGAYLTLVPQTGKATIILEDNGTTEGVWSIEVSVPNISGLTIINSANSFVAGQYLTNGASTYVLAQSNSQTTLPCIARVISANANQYAIFTSGVCSTNLGLDSGLTANTSYIISNITAGAVIAYPTTPSDGQLIQPVFEASSATSGVFNPLTVSTWNANTNILKINNAIINGDFNVWQRGTSFTFVANNTYTADRWLYLKNGSMVHDIILSSDVPTVAQAGRLFSNSLRINCTTVDSSIISSDYATIKQKIEGYNFLPLAQKEITLSFWVKATKTGVYSVALTNGGDDRSCVKEINIIQSNTWEKKAITFSASPSSGTWNYTDGIGLQLSIVLAGGSSFQTTPNTWQTGNYLATSNQVNACDSTSNVFYITGIQLESGSVANFFENRTIQQELQLCQRYYHTELSYVAPLINSLALSKSCFPMIMRSAPIVAGGGAGFTEVVKTNIGITYYQTTTSSQNLTFNSEL